MTSTDSSTVRAHAEDLIDLVAASPSALHAAAEVARRLEAAGFTRLSESEPWGMVPGGRYVLVRDGAVLAWVVPASAGATTGFHVLGAHSDSPGFRLKPQPSTGSRGWLQAGVEVYGGPLLNSWLDRELVLAGRLVTADGASHLVATPPLLRLPQLAIHLDRAANDGLALDKQTQTQPVWGVGDASGADLLAEVAAVADVPRADVRGYDLVLADSARGAVFGAGEAFLAVGRLDDLASVHAGLRAFERLVASSAVDALTHVPVLAVFDHEEVGSASRTGAAGPLLGDVLGRIGAALGADVGAGGEDHHRALADSWLVSSDVGHSVHPNYAGRHDPVVQPVLGSGPILKINANQRYTTDGAGEAAWRGWSEAAGVAVQEFVSNNAVPCGSTIGPIASTRLGIRTLDVGIPILSMHSARELAGTSDLLDLSLVAEAFWRA
ncbi:M18 family aminopeptidase [Litorihabitans aurantiacus]|uniref:M18 family aminopeptidase n=1 Tax=Litorihabitans aurantiacus TaxID=1930061 RepID=A0AA37XI64_9MICO|nr:M18 family aminopeptidase [Litorihabitans aurantiacus]GMA33020.1 M18 family aminopeptidase [Litorihabitans aurantiacus]